MDLFAYLIMHVFTYGRKKKKKKKATVFSTHQNVPILRYRLEIKTKLVSLVHRNRFFKLTLGVKQPNIYFILL